MDFKEESHTVICSLYHIRYVTLYTYIFSLVMLVGHWVKLVAYFFTDKLLLCSFYIQFVIIESVNPTYTHSEGLGINIHLLEKRASKNLWTWIKSTMVMTKYFVGDTLRLCKYLMGVTKALPPNFRIDQWISCSNDYNGVIIVISSFGVVNCPFCIYLFAQSFSILMIYSCTLIVFFGL